MQQSAEAAAAAVRVEYTRKDAEVRLWVSRHNSAGAVMPSSASCGRDAVLIT
jgi:hypothetical protein